MPKLFVDKTIEINAIPARVWAALTLRENTDKWASEFSSGGPKFHIESGWKLGSPVLWKGEDDQPIVQGFVTAYEVNKLLRYTVFDIRSEEQPSVSDTDGITYELTEQKGKTILHVLQGDFSSMQDGEKYCRMSAETWDRVLPVIKALAEAPARRKE